MVFRIKGLEFIEPFKANSKKEATIRALKMLGFSFGADKDIKENGEIQTLKDLGYELELIK